MAIVEQLTVFAISLLTGGLGIYFAARLVTGVDDYSYAIGTALVGAIIWGVVGFFAGWIPLIGSIIVLLAWIGVINWRYPGGWIDASLIGLSAWIATLIILSLLATVGLPNYGSIGVPAI